MARAHGPDTGWRTGAPWPRVHGSSRGERSRTTTGNGAMGVDKVPPGGGVAPQRILLLALLTLGVWVPVAHGGCTATRTSLVCPAGFSLPSVKLYNHATLHPTTKALTLSGTPGGTGCAYSSLPLNLRAFSPGRPSFSAHFVFTSKKQSRGREGMLGDPDQPGFVFLLASKPRDCGYYMFGYDFASSLASSLGVQFQRWPYPCVGLVYGGLSAGRFCAGSDFSAILNASTTGMDRAETHAWVAYDGGTRQLQVYLSPTAKRPTLPALVAAPVTLASHVNVSQAYVGFTGGVQCDEFARDGWDCVGVHSILSLSVKAVAAGAPPKALARSDACTHTRGSVLCPFGFGGRGAFQSPLILLVPSAPGPPAKPGTRNPFVNPGVAYGITPAQKWTHPFACTLFSSPVNLSSVSPAPSFSASFSYILTPASEIRPRAPHGFVFLLAGKAGCGDENSWFGYETPHSVGVQFQYAPSPCVALVYGGKSARNRCTESDFFADLKNGTDIAPGRVSYAWVRYDGRTQQLAVYTSVARTQPPSPSLVAQVNLGAQLGGSQAYVGFTGNAACDWTFYSECIPAETHVFTSLTLQAAAAGSKTLPVTAAHPGCTFTRTSIACPAFAGKLGMVNLAGAAIQGRPYPLVLDLFARTGRYDDSAYGCSHSPSRVNLTALSRSPAFSAHFSFTLSRGSSYSAGFRFLLFQDPPACELAWDDDVSLPTKSGSVGVHFQTLPDPSVALVTKGMPDSISDYGVCLGTSSAPLPGGQPTHAWVSYDGGTQQLLVYLAQTPTKPTKPVLVAQVSLARELKTNVPYVGFFGQSTAGRSKVWNRHTFHSFSFNAVPAGAKRLPPTPAPTCRYDKSSISCPGFGGKLKFVNYELMGRTRPYALDLELYSRGDEDTMVRRQGCAISDYPISLAAPSKASASSSVPSVGDATPSAPSVASASSSAPSVGGERSADPSVGSGSSSVPSVGGASPSVVAFRARFEFRFSTQTEVNPRSGFIFLLAAKARGCGWNGYGYEGEETLRASVGVQFLAAPHPCVALVQGGKSAGEACAKSNYSVSLRNSKAFTRGGRNHAWVSYSSSTQQLRVFLSQTPGQPAKPVLVARADLAARLKGTAAYVGFTGAGECEPFTSNMEHQKILSLHIQGGAS